MIAHALDSVVGGSNTVLLVVSCPVPYLDRCRYGRQMAVRGAIMAGIAKQLGHPSGLRGRLVGVALNHGNRSFVGAAVQALQPDATAIVADVGFGGGVGLKFLLDSIGHRAGCTGSRCRTRCSARPHVDTAATSRPAGVAYRVIDAAALRG